MGGRVIEDYFDIGQSRSVTWERRTHGSRLLAALRDPHRGWTGVVVGEGTRCCFGNQFSLVVPKFAAYGVDMWVPELGGKFDPRNPSHKMLMSVLSGMSESERQHVQARVRAAMDAQVVNEGRHRGGRAPCGYLTMNAGPLTSTSRKAPAGDLTRKHCITLCPGRCHAAQVVSRYGTYRPEPYARRAFGAVPLAGVRRVRRCPCRPSPNRPEELPSVSALHGRDRQPPLASGFLLV